jgi:PAS domain S-box-containing protein
MMTGSRTLKRAVAQRATELLRDHRHSIWTTTDRLFAWLMVVQWLGTIAVAVWISPRVWAGSTSSVHVHVWAALILGGLFTIFPVVLTLARPGEPITRHTIAVGQMLMSALLIHVTGGRIETHFHVFGSLAFLAMYRDPWVLLPATIVVAVDHAVRGMYWPESVYGIASISTWRWVEHVWWVGFENAVLVGSLVRSKREMEAIALRTAELEVSEGRCREAIERAAEGIGMFDLRTGEAVEANAALQQMTGAIDVKQMTLSSLVPDSRLTEITRGEERITAEHEHVSPAGRLHYLAVSVSPFRYGEDRFGWVVARDVTEQRRLETQLRQRQRIEAIGQLAGGIAHDFNNLLMAIQGYTEILMEDASQQPQTLAHLQQIHRASESAAAMTSQLLAFGRKQILRPVTFCLNAHLREIKQLLDRLVGPQFVLELDLAAGLPAIRCDRTQIEQVVINLVLNARDAMSNGGAIRIVTRFLQLDGPCSARPLTPKGEYVALTVSDHGCGMTPEIVSQIFEPFFTTKSAGHGTGLGLATVYGIVKQSEGFIYVDSAVNRGTTFEVLLPAHAAAHSMTIQQPVASRSSVERHDRTILVVDDEPAVRGLVSRGLERLGFTVVTAGDGRDGLRIFREHRKEICVVLTDLLMPHMGGRELAAAVRQEHPDMPVVFMSGYSDGGADAVPSRDPFLRKPFTVAQLSERIQETLVQRGDAAGRSAVSRA